MMIPYYKMGLHILQKYLYGKITDYLEEYW